MRERKREISIAEASVGYVRLAGRAVGQQLPKWSGKQYPCAELRAEQQHRSTGIGPRISPSVRPSVHRSVVRSFGRCVGPDLIASTITTSLPIREREKMCIPMCACVMYPPRLYSLHPIHGKSLYINSLKRPRCAALTADTTTDDHRQTHRAFCDPVYMR